MRKLVVLTFLLICYTASLYAQDTRMITGKVVDQKTNTGLGGVTINAGSAKSLSDANGNYQINITDQKSVNFSIIGYAKLVRTIGTASTINF